MGEPRVSPPRTPPRISAESRSIFIRPPRPKPCWRRASSRASTARPTRKPAGRPERMAVRPGPWLSPPVMRLSRRTPRLVREVDEAALDVDVFQAHAHALAHVEPLLALDDAPLDRRVEDARPGALVGGTR